MTDEAAKVINLSLCKMAESRSVRRGTSLHKHLLIAKVLNKARSAYLEKLYSGDSEYFSPESPLPSISTFAGQNSSLSFDDTDSSIETDSDITNAEVIDPSFFVEVEGDIDQIELPSDILSCVEKLTGEDMRFLTGHGEKESTPMTSVVSSPQTSNVTISSNSASTSRSRGNFGSDNSDSIAFSTSSSASEFLSLTFTCPMAGPFTSSSKCTKRRRTWSLEDDYEQEESDADDEGYSEERFSFDQFLPQDVNEKLKKNGVSVTKSITKRRRLSKSTCEYSSTKEENIREGQCKGKAEGAKEDDSRKLFRTKNAIFDADAIEESEDDDDSFLDDDFERRWSSSSTFSKSCDESNTKNDRRVPSASSGSDEEADDNSSSMEVDQITSLVKYFTFKQQSNSSSPSCPPSSPTGNLVNQHDSIILSGLTRSLSTPDLYGIHKSKELKSDGIVNHQMLPLKV